jgi:hypothetical protein
MRKVIYVRRRIVDWLQLNTIAMKLNAINIYGTTCLILKYEIK